MGKISRRASKISLRILEEKVVSRCNGNDGRRVFLMSPSPDEQSMILQDLLHQIDGELSDDRPSADNENRLSTGEDFQSQPHKEIRLGAGFFLFINQNETQALLKYIPPSPPPKTIKAQHLLDQIKGLGYTCGLLEKNIQKAAQIIREKPDAEVDVIVAVGRDPSPGHPGEIDYWIGNEEYHKKIGFIHARKNDLLLRITPPKPGLPGINLAGERIAPPPINEIGIKPGENVRLTPDGEYYAERPGIVVLKDMTLSLCETKRDASATVVVSEDRMQVLLTIEPPMGNGLPANLEQIQALLNEAGVRAGVQYQTIEQVLQIANSQRNPVRYAIIAHGIPPTVGRDASFLWRINPKLLRDRYIINEDGSIDFYNQNNILSVTEGDHLATVHPASEGRNGFNVFGETLAGKSGKPIDVQPGANIEIRNGGTEWFAACSGQYRLHQNTLEVQPLFYVKGDVDFSVGNINFNGDVLIAGNVLDGFEVRAQGCISVIGTVEAAILEAGKNIEVKNGIFGKEKGKVTAGADVVSNFLQNAVVCAGRDVITGSQILNSRVYARRNVEVRFGKGILVGGLTVAGFAVKAKIIGSEYGVRTVIEVGADYQILERMMNAGKKEKSLTAKADLLESVIEKEIQNHSFIEDEKAQILLDARQRQDKLRSAIVALRAEYQSLATQLYATGKPQIAAQEGIMTDVYIRMRDARYKFNSSTKRALVEFDEETGKIVVTGRGA